MTYVQELPTKRVKSNKRMPFMTLLVGSVTAMTVTLGVLNTWLEDWAVASMDMQTLNKVEFISARVAE